MNNKLLIIGASGHGKVVADIAIKMNKWKSIAFLDDNKTINTCLGLEVVGRIEDAFKYKEEADFFVAIGRNEVREKIQEKLVLQKLNLVSLIHPSAVIGIDVEVGIGTVIMAGVVVNSSTKIGNGCIINTSSSLDHDNNIGDYIHISPGVNIAGTVNISNRTWIGIGSVVKNNIKICCDCIIGAGAIVIKDITEPGIYFGVPARRFDR